ncbi:MAG: radical SAM protein [Lachnospiraceae bacterium]|nr:radical SAM protein [Lachnospiraceae bacterium]
MTRNEIKTRNLDTLAAYHEKLRKAPQLRQLFFELTLRCNEHCFHCGSSCAGDLPHGLAPEVYLGVLDEVAERYEKKPLVAVTGGEPLLYPDFFPLMEAVRDKGFRWGMTSNGTLIDKETARHLKEAGMRTISLSIDGTEETHDRYRGLPGAYRMGMEGIQNLIDLDCFNVMVTTVVNHQNINELDRLFEIFDNMDINVWRLTGLEPIGRAEKVPEMHLTADDNRRLMEFILEKRSKKLPVEYSCCHFLGLKYEAEVRDWYFLCNAGVYVAGILVNGDVTACLDIPHGPGTIQGNILKEKFTDIWENRFEIFRRPLSERNETCASCPQAKWCRGGSYHSWDYDHDRPKVCMKGILFE